MAYWFHSMNLKDRVLLVVIALVFAGIWGLALRMSVLLQADTEKLVAQQLSAQVDFVAKELDEELQIRIYLLNEIAASMTLGVPANAAEVQRLLDEQKPPLVMFPLGILIINKDGMIIADYSANPARRRAGFLGDRDFFREVMANNKPLIGRPVLGRFSGLPVIPIAVPLHDASGAVAGVLHAPLRNSDRDLFGKLREAKVGTSGRFRVMSPKDGLIVAATEASDIMKPLPPKGQNRMADRRLYEGFEAAAVTVTPLGVEVLGASRKLITAGWVLIGNITTEEAFAPIRAFKNRIYIAALLVSLIIAVILYFFLKRQLLPLESAGAAMQRMTAGAEPFGAIPVTRHDEIGRLVESFNQLAAERQRAEDQIRNFNHTLEDRVSERTAELKTSHSELQALTAVQESFQEEERKRMARELHDELAQKLTVLKLQLQALGSTLPPHERGLSRQLDDMNLLLTDTMRAVGQIAANLRPVVLDKLGLVTAVRDLVEEFSERTKVECEFSVHPADLSVSSGLATPLYRMVQESLTNVARHAQATEVIVSLFRDPSGKITLDINDNGKGFSNADQSMRSSFGLIGMRERAAMLGGEMKIHSQPGAGTSIEIVIPENRS